MSALGAMKSAIPRLPPLPTISEILKLYRLRAQKHLAQNFLLDQKLNRKIVRAAGNLKDAYVLEIGPGPGSLTRPIIDAGVKELVVIEKDARFLPVLNELKEACPDTPFTIIQNDILKYDLQGVFPDEARRPWEDQPPPVHVIANLPFNISSPLIIQFLEQISRKTGIFRYGRVKLTLMFQHEVAQRIISYTDNPQRSRLSVICQNYCDVKYVFPIKGTSFLPKPDVDAGVVTFVPKIEPVMKQPFKMIEKVVRNIYNQKSKPAINPTKLLFPDPYKHFADRMFEMAEVSPKRPAMGLEVEDFARLVQAYEDICKEYPELLHYQFR